jgi:lia operon protein LiaF
MDLGVTVNSSSFIGDMQVLEQSRSGFMSSVQCKTPYYKEAGKKIRINVSAFIGDIKVKSVG